MKIATVHRRYASGASDSLRGRKGSRRAPERRGAAAVEFAVVAPLMFMLVFGMIEIGRAVMVAQIVTNVSRVAARRASLGNATSNTVATITADSLTDLGDMLLGGGTFAVGDATVTITRPDDTAVANNFSDVLPGDPLKATVQVSFAAVTWLPPGVTQRFMPNNAVIPSSTVMRKEHN